MFARVRAHVQACSRVHVRMHACVLCGCMHACACVRAQRVCVRIHVCAGVFARVRAHACVFMHGCVCACVFGPTHARVHACLCARARMRHVHVHAHSRADARARKSKCPHEEIKIVYVYERTLIWACIMMMIAFITVNSSLVPLIEGLCA